MAISMRVIGSQAQTPSRSVERLSISLGRNGSRDAWSIPSWISRETLFLLSAGQPVLGADHPGTSQAWTRQNRVVTREGCGAAGTHLGVIYLLMGVTTTFRKWISLPSEVKHILPGLRSHSVALLTSSPLMISVTVAPLAMIS